MKNSLKKQSLALAFIVTAFSGCLGSRSQASLDEISDSLGTSSPYVEAFIEYGAPQSKWVGPTAFLLHIDAKDNTATSIAVTPAMFEKVKPSATMGERVPASVSQAGMTTNVARDHLTELAKNMEEGGTPYSGCLNPIRVRLIRQDGTLTEKQGCRGFGWARSASEKVNIFLGAYVSE